MPDQDIDVSVLAELEPKDLVEIGVYRTEADAWHHGLVVLAMRQPYWLAPTAESVRLLVEPQIAAAARRQLESYDRESVGWPPRPERADSTMRAADFVTPLLWAALILAAFRWQVIAPGTTRAGTLDTQAIFERGEWWRVATALFLHADAGRVLSNAVSGIFIFSAVLTTLGRLRGWILLAAASIVANFAVACLRSAEVYRSLGASTAIFAGLGLLTGRAIQRAARTDHPHRWRGMFVPFAAGATVLGLYGAGGVQIDVGAHAAGYLAGLLFGHFAGLQRRQPTGVVD